MKGFRRIGLFFAVLLGIAFLVSCAGTSEKKEEITREGEIHLQIGTNYLNKGNLEMAHFELNKAASINASLQQSLMGLSQSITQEELEKERARDLKNKVDVILMPQEGERE